MTKFEELSEELQTEVSVLCGSMGIPIESFNIDEYLKNKN
tara:strand:- start:11 stop:130 length:120 start_codon:yes stop_codon:yes gene_type:complete